MSPAVLLPDPTLPCSHCHMQPDARVWQVLLACMKCPGSHLLTNQNLIDMFQACFRIGHYQGDSSKGMQGVARLQSLSLSYTTISTCRHSMTPAAIHLRPLVACQSADDGMSRAGTWGTPGSG